MKIVLKINGFSGFFSEFAIVKIRILAIWQR
jgi:hypothetical protein